MTSLRIQSTPLKGKILAQPSKSMAHRALICAALAKGESHIDNIVLSDDMIATMAAIRMLGADVTLEDSLNYKGRKKITVKSQGQISLKGNQIDCLESGSTARFIMPITRLSADSVTITGRGRLVERPFEIYKELFTQKGVIYSDCDGKMPITLSGKLVGGQYTLPGNVSSQFISGLLFTLPLLEEPSIITVTNKLESLPYIQMTLAVLKEFGIEIRYDGSYQNFDIPGGQNYRAKPEYVVEGDWSQAAFFCVIGALSESLTLEGIIMDSLQGDKVIINILEQMGAKPLFDRDSVTFRKSKLKGIDIDVSQCPDLVPAISVAASLAEGTTRITNAARLRIKESDRLASTSQALGALGARIIEEPDGLIIEGVPCLKGGTASGAGDHRIVMALATASTVCQGVIEINGSDAVNKSYPEFWQDFITLGGKLEDNE